MSDLIRDLLINTTKAVVIMPRSEVQLVAKLAEYDLVILMSDDLHITRPATLEDVVDTPVEVAPDTMSKLEETSDSESDHLHGLTTDDLRDLLRDLKKEDGTNRYAEETIRTLPKNFYRVIPQKDEVTHPCDLLDVEAVRKFAEDESINISVRSTCLNAFNVVFSLIHPDKDDLRAQHKAIFETIKKQADDSRILRTPTIKEEADQVSNEDVRIKMEDLALTIAEEDTMLWSREVILHTILALNHYVGALRQTEFLTTRWDSEDGNSLDSTAWQFIIRKHKTVAKHGVKVIDVPEALRPILTDIRRRSNSDWLIPSLTNPSTNPLNERVYRRWLQETIGATTRTLRQSVVSEAKANGTSGADMKELARVMGHTVETQQLVYGVQNNK